MSEPFSSITFQITCKYCQCLVRRKKLIYQEISRKNSQRRKRASCYTICLTRPFRPKSAAIYANYMSTIQKNLLLHMSMVCSMVRLHSVFHSILSCISRSVKAEAISCNCNFFYTRTQIYKHIHMHRHTVLVSSILYFTNAYLRRPNF